MIVINLYQTTLAAVILVGPKRAYRQIPVDRHDFHLLGFTVDGQVYFHTVMSFGLPSATLTSTSTLFKFGNITRYIGTGLQLARLFEAGQAT